MQLDSFHALIQTAKERADQHAELLRRNESLTRYVLIDPLLRELGWDTGNPDEVIAEYSAGRGRADYAFITDGKPVIMIEAKSLGSNLHDSGLTQGITYCVDTGTPYFAVTDGMKWEVYETFKPVQTDEKILIAFDLASMMPSEAVFKALVLWKRNIQSGILTTPQTPIVNTFPQVDVVPPRPPIIEEGEVPFITRDQLRALPEGDVALYPSHPSGVEFLVANNAWGFIRISRIPKYFALYISQPVYEVQYFAEIEGVLDPSKETLPTGLQNVEGTGHRDPGKKLITFKQGRMWKLADPITYGIPRRPGKAPQNLQFHQLSKLANAATLDDLRA